MWSANVCTQAQKIKLIVLDVDGVLTDGGLYYSEHGLTQKRFNVQDGFAIRIAQDLGLEFAIITGQMSPCVERRAHDLKIIHYYPGYIQKLPALETLAKKLNLNFNEIAFVGDDWIDIPILNAVGLPLCVANAPEEVKEKSLACSKAIGGQGAVRELIIEILKAKNLYQKAIKPWIT